MIDYLTAILLGFIEGLTEFIPVSSTGHLILLIEGLKFPTPPGRVFEVFIQLGAICAVVVLYHKKLFGTLAGLHKDPVAQRFATNIVIGTIPALILGAAFHGFIKGTLYNPMVIATTLILGGIVILLFEKKFTDFTVPSVDDITPRQAFLIGCCQAVALIPGVSRSGATIMGSLAMGLSRTAAAEFSFFLAVPVMACAVAYDVCKNWDELAAYPDLGMMFAAFAAAFVTAMVVIRFVLGLITKYGFAPFAWYRIALGLATFVIFS